MDDKIVIQASSSATAVPVSDDEENDENVGEQETHSENQDEPVVSPKEIDAEVAFTKETEETSEPYVVTNGNGVSNNYIKSPSPTEITPPASVEGLPIESNFNFEIDEYTIADEMKQVRFCC